MIITANTIIVTLRMYKMKEFITERKQKPVTLETRVPKNYVKAKALKECEQKRKNIAIEESYHALIEYVKRLYATLPDQSDRIFVEMDRSKEPANPISIYCFMTKHFYFYMECDVFLQYRIEYQLEQCPFEKEILDGLKSHLMQSYSKEVMKMPNYPDFFKEVLRVQPGRFKQVL